MKLEDLINAVSASAGVPRDVARKVVTASLDQIKDMINRGESFTSPVVSFTADTNKSTGRPIARVWIPNKPSY